MTDVAENQLADAANEDERMSCGHPRSALRWSRWPEMPAGVQTTHHCWLCRILAEQEGRELQNG